MQILIVGISTEITAAIKGAFKGIAASTGKTCEVIQVEDEKQALQEIFKKDFAFVFAIAPKEQIFRFIPIEKRRECVCIALDKEGRSLDVFTAFIKNADGVVNVKDLNKLEEYMTEIAKRHEELYRGFFKVKAEVEVV